MILIKYPWKLLEEQIFEMKSKYINNKNNKKKRTMRIYHLFSFIPLRVSNYFTSFVSYKISWRYKNSFAKMYSL